MSASQEAYPANRDIFQSIGDILISGFIGPSEASRDCTLRPSEPRNVLDLWHIDECSTGEYKDLKGPPPLHLPGKHYVEDNSSGEVIELPTAEAAEDTEQTQGYDLSDSMNLEIPNISNQELDIFSETQTIRVYFDQDVSAPEKTLEYAKEIEATRYASKPLPEPPKDDIGAGDRSLPVIRINSQLNRSSTETDIKRLDFPPSSNISSSQLRPKCKELSAVESMDFPEGPYVFGEAYNSPSKSKYSNNFDLFETYVYDSSYQTQTSTAPSLPYCLKHGRSIRSTIPYSVSVSWNAFSRSALRSWPIPVAAYGKSP